jgi:ribosomal protein S12 methylthiotransferase
VTRIPPPPAKRVRVGFLSLGCAKNLVDTEVMLGHLDRAGAALVQDPEEADVLVVNTCGFIEAAREESIRTILETAELKASGRLKRLVVAGCLVQRYPNEMRANLPEVDAWIGLDELASVVSEVGLEAGERDAAASPGPGVARPGPSAWIYDHATPRRLSTPPWTAFVKVAEGCDHACAFCAIPSFRGRFRSRSVEDIATEASRLAGSGVREINLISQDTSDYGRDLGLRDGLVRLLEALDGIPDLRWIRAHYLYPNSVSPALVEAMARLARVVKYVDLPLQHSHRDVLGRMRRGGSAASHLALLSRFRDAMPEVALRTTMIVGFPGETEGEFSDLLRFVEEARFDHLGVFSYSHEEGTHAFSLSDDVPEEIKEERRERLMEAQQRVAFGRLERHVGRTVEVLVEGAHPETEHLLVGRTSGQASDVDGQVILNDGWASPGTFARVEITGRAGYDLVGRILGEA